MYQYSFANVDLILEVPNLQGVYRRLNVRGFGTGENLIHLMRRAPIASPLFGAYGDMVVNMQRIRAGDLAFPVLMNAPENKYLQDYANDFQSQAEAHGTLIYPIQGYIRDNMGEDEAHLRNGVILEIPALSRGQTMNVVTWTITFEHTEFIRKIGRDAQDLGV